MNTLDTLKLALEALESKYIVNCGAWRVQQDEAITALRQAIEQAEQAQRWLPEKIYEFVPTPEPKCELADKAEQAQPVACMVETEHGVMVWPIDDINEAGTYCDVDKFPELLYTAPPPRQPLTDAQANDIMERESWGPDALTLNAQLLRTIRRTEAAHGIGKEKNA